MFYKSLNGKCQFKKFCGTKEKGAGLMRLILVIILLVIGFITYKSITKPHRRKFWSTKLTPKEVKNAEIDAYVPDEGFWNEYCWITSKVYLSQTMTPREEQPQITEEIVINGPIYNDMGELGTLSMAIAPNGAITGSWEGKTPKNEDHDYRCKLIGSIYPEAEHREDPSKLFLVGKVQIGDSPKLDCSIYIRGWLDSDYAAEGKILFYKKHIDLKRGLITTPLIGTFNWEAKANKGSSG